MKIQNKYVDIQLGKQHIKKHNFFLDSYLKLFIDGQLDNQETTSWINGAKNISKYLYIKLDTPLQVDESSILTSNDFDMYISTGTASQRETDNSITTTYTFSNDGLYYLKQDGVYTPYSEKDALNGRKITGISYDLYTYLDTSEYDLRFHDSETLKVSREDIFTTDAICKGYPYPYHLAPVLKGFEYESGAITRTAQYSSYLYSVGLGYRAGVMEEEYVIGEDIDIVREDDFTFSFVLKKATDYGIYPSNNGYPSLVKQPLRFKIKTSKYPSESLYSGSNLYPSFSDYKYIIMKYKLYYYRYAEDNPTLTGDEYTMSFYTNKEGILTIKTKIERNDE